MHMPRPKDLPNLPSSMSSEKKFNVSNLLHSPTPTINSFDPFLYLRKTFPHLPIQTLQMVFEMSQGNLWTATNILIRQFINFEKFLLTKLPTDNNGSGQFMPPMRPFNFRPMISPVDCNGSSPFCTDKLLNPDLFNPTRSCMTSSMFGPSSMVDAKQLEPGKLPLTIFNEFPYNKDH